MQVQLPTLLLKALQIVFHPHGMANVPTYVAAVQDESETGCVIKARAMFVGF